MADFRKIIYLAVSISITIIVVFSIMRASDTAQVISNFSISAISQMERDVLNWDLMQYDQKELMGSEVLNFVKRQLGEYEADKESDLYIRVVTIFGDYTYVNNESIPLMKDISSSHYINPMVKFQGMIEENTNDVIVGIKFTYQ